MLAKSYCTLGLALTSAFVCATTKGLNQIVTPDLQPVGQFSLSLQYQNPAIGNSLQTQYELGVTKQFEVALFNGNKPGEQVLATEVGLIQQKEWLVSAGFLGWSTRGDQPSPFVETGYYKGNWKLMAGVQRTGKLNLPVAGVGYQVNPDLLLQADYLAGSSNYITAGFNYNITKTLSINPAMYVANAGGHKVYPYAVLTWNVTAWKG
jgi:hypothetical protein